MPFKLLIAPVLILADLLLLPDAVAKNHPEKHLLFLGDSNYPPFEFLHEGKPKGLAVDIFHAVTKEAGLKADQELLLWSRAQELVLAGKADGHAFMSTTPLREEHYDFSHPITTVEFTLFVNERDKDRVKLNSLAGLKTGVTKGGLPYQYLSTLNPEVDLVIIKNDTDGIGRLLKGEIDAISTNRLTGLHLIQKHGVKGIVPVPWSLVEKKPRIALRKGNPVLLATINTAIDTLQEKGKLKTIKKQWLSSYTDTIDWTRQQYLIPLAAGLLVFFIFLYFLITRLRTRKGDENEATKS